MSSEKYQGNTICIIVSLCINLHIYIYILFRPYFNDQLSHAQIPQDAFQDASLEYLHEQLAGTGLVRTENTKEVWDRSKAARLCCLSQPGRWQTAILPTWSKALTTLVTVRSVHQFSRH